MSNVTTKLYIIRKFFAVTLVALVVILFGITTPAQAATTNSITSVGVAKAVPTFVTNSVTPVTSVPVVIGNSGIKPAWLYVSCYWAMNGEKWCWRYGCTYFEYVALGCRDGWYRVSTTWWA